MTERARVENWCSAIQRRKALLDVGGWYLLNVGEKGGGSR